jgi:uroporphyrinogen-III synthase
MRVLVTRPISEAAPWLAGLTAAGHDAVALPLIEISPVQDVQPLIKAWQDASQWQAVMFVSAAAVKHFFAAVPPQALNLAPCWATGPGTRKALVQAGVPEDCIASPDGLSAQFDSEALWQVVAPSVTTEKPVLIVRGTDETDPISEASENVGVGRNWLSQTLQDAGVSVHWVVSYQRGLPIWTADQRHIAQTASNDGSVWCFSSSQAISFLTRLLPQQDWSTARCIATHVRIAEAAKEIGFGKISLCRPLVADMVASLELLA